ncbi:coiled-coil domain-containing protein 96-like isoform X2 [Harmonia axyridis]|uniref:coiled-coil domain-containing protein 96-like isoform X2 n=1 Tax=Harmonia axyridis TaxID=115357 RepID=UPI001E27979A|nr:coiled-coil domain-containing protein 96-like isoform X2 [Harmonia axyridis]
MSQNTESIDNQTGDEPISEATTEITEVTATDTQEIANEPDEIQQGPEESLETHDEEGEETKVEETTETAEGETEVEAEAGEKPVEAADDETKPVEASVEGIESEDVDFDETKIAEEIDEADRDQAIEGEPTEEVDATQEGEAEEEKEELTEGEKLLAEIDTTKVIEEADTEIDYQRHVVLDTEASHITLNPDDLPEIRGLAELEYESPDDSQKDVTFDDLYLSRRKSARPSLAVKLMAEEEAAEKKRRARRDLAKGKKVAEEEEEEIAAVVVPLTREENYALHEKLTAELAYIRMKNKYLQRKMADFFKKRKMEHALREENEIHTEALQKYEKKLDRLADLFAMYSAETSKIQGELDIQQKEKEDKYSERDQLFQRAVNREREIGIGLISTKTGKEIPDKVVEQLIRRQVNATKQIADLRLKFITKRDELAEKTAELKALDNIGEDLSLMDYEQLKIENRAHSDKLEEKEEELTKLRVKCRNAVQIMAHVREKSAALDADMDVLKEEFEEVHYQYIEIRERLNFYKTERDVIRNKTMKLKAESGLLTKPNLLQDMETSMKEVKLYEKTLEKVKNEYNKKTQQIRNLRKNIAYEMVMSKKQPRERKKKKTTAKFYGGRPTLIVPRLPKTFIDRLEAKSKAVNNLKEES